MTHLTDNLIEQAALGWLKDICYTIVFGGDIVLGSLRDSLLPKLMRGEVRVKDVGK